MKIEINVENGALGINPSGENLSKEKNYRSLIFSLLYGL